MDLSALSVSCLDRGFLFGDAVYEVFAVLDGCVLEQQGHLNRLKNSLESIDLFSPTPLEEIPALQKNLLEQDNLLEGSIYLQITRGEAPVRDFAFPKDPKPNLIMFTQSKQLIDDPLANTGIKVITVPDLRWKRRNIKTVQLLGACLAKQEAIKAGKDDAWMEEDGFITEGTASNAYIIRGNTIVTRQLGADILPGITRQSVLQIAHEEKLYIEERPFTLQEARNADEAFMTAATAFVTPVIEIDNHPIGSGQPGSLTKLLRKVYINTARKQALLTQKPQKTPQ